MWEDSYVQRIVNLPWRRFGELYVGESIALSVLAFATFVCAVAAMNRFLAGDFNWPKKSRAGGSKKRAFGLKYFALLFVALLPGGLVGTFAVYAVMGKDHWRRDALLIVGASLAPALLLILMRATFFPWPGLRDSVYVGGIVGLVFGVLQLWALIKLLRESIGEPDECVPWWPPLALWAQSGLLIAAIMGTLGW